VQVCTKECIGAAYTREVQCCIGMPVHTRGAVTLVCIGIRTHTPIRADMPIRTLPFLVYTRGVQWCIGIPVHIGITYQYAL
jgi:hypothetical protein